MNGALHPDFPVVEGQHQLTKNWQLTLDGKFNRRIDNGSLVIWRPGLTFWMDVYGNDKNLSPNDQIKEFTKNASTAAYNKVTDSDAQVSRLSYQLDEDHGGKQVTALYSFTASQAGILTIVAYADSAEDLDLSQKIVASVQPI